MEQGLGQLRFACQSWHQHVSCGSLIVESYSIFALRIFHYKCLLFMSNISCTCWFCEYFLSNQAQHPWNGRANKTSNNPPLTPVRFYNNSTPFFWLGEAYMKKFLATFLLARWSMSVSLKQLWEQQTLPELLTLVKHSQNKMTCWLGKDWSRSVYKCLQKKKIGKTLCLVVIIS